MTYLIKADALGFSRIEASNLPTDRRNTYEAEGYRSVTELEFNIARLISTHHFQQVIRIARELAKEMGEEID